MKTQLFLFYELLLPLKKYLDNSDRLIEGNTLKFSSVITNDNRTHYIDFINFLKNNSSCPFASLQDRYITDNDVALDKVFSLDITLVYGGDNSKIYLNEEQYLERNNLNAIPNELFFAQSLTYYDYTHHNYKVDKIKNISSLVSKLQKLSDFTLEETERSKKIIFIDKDNSKNHISISTLCDQSIFDLDYKGISLLDDIFIEEHSFSKKEKFIFRNTIIDFFKYKSDNQLSTLVKNWKEFEILFGNNLQAYFNDFNFNKNLQKVADESIKISEQISKASSDMTFKILSIPAALILTFSYFDKVDEVNIIFLLSSFVASIFSSFVLYRYVKLQRNNAKLLIRQKNNIFSQFSFLSNEESHKLRKKLLFNKKIVNKSIKYSLRTIDAYIILSFLPIVIWSCFALYRVLTYFELEYSNILTLRIHSSWFMLY